MNKDYLTRTEDGRIFQIPLDGIRTYHRKINGFDIFVYNLEKRGKSHGWVCIDTVSGACIDNQTWGHKYKEEAFKSAENRYNEYTNEQIGKAQKKTLNLLGIGT